MSRFSILAASFIACACLQAQSPFQARIAEIDRTMDRHYRGERLEDVRDRSNRDIEAYNARTRSTNAELEKAKQKMEQALAPGREAYAKLQEMDKGLKDIPDGNDAEGNKRYQERITARNAFAHRVNELNDAGKAALDEYNATVKRQQAALDEDRKRVIAEQEALNARYAAFNAFSKGGQDVAFFTSINRLLADVRQAQRAHPSDATLAEPLSKVRAFRRELALWAMAGQARQSNGLVIVEVQVGDEPCWLIVDTGATEVVLSGELVDALDLSGSLGAEASLVLVGGQRILGRSFKVPRMDVAGQTRNDVEASAVRPSDVGIDGLLGQSFLKAFTYTIDERNPAKLMLVRR